MCAHTQNPSRDLIGSLGLVLEDYAMIQKAGLSSLQGHVENRGTLADSPS